MRRVLLEHYENFTRTLREFTRKPREFYEDITRVYEKTTRVLQVLYKIQSQFLVKNLLYSMSKKEQILENRGTKCYPVWKLKANI